MALETTQERIRPVTGTHIVRVQHEGIVTADAERSKDFYCRVFGWKVLERPAFKAGREHAAGWTRADAVQRP